MNFCYENKLSVNDKKVVECIKYWKEKVIDANQVTDDLISFAEEFYQEKSINAFGITKDTYQYLVGLMDKST